MATFRLGRAVNIHWQGYDIVGPALTVFSIPDQLYEEFNNDISPVEPTLVWIDTNEFLTLSNSVSVTTLTGTIPISVTSTTSGKVVSISSTTNPAGYYLRADGTGATTWAALPADATGITNIVGTSPISAAVSGTTATISLNANYQTAGSYQPSGTYVTGVVGTSPISATGTTAITVSLNANYQTAGTYVNAIIGTSPASVATASGTSTVTIVAGSIDSTHLSANSVGSTQIATGAVGAAQIAANSIVLGDIVAGAVDSAALASNAVVAAKIAAAAVGTSAINSGAATTGQVLTADGAGAATFTTISASPVSYSSQSITLNTWSYNTRILQAVTSVNVTGNPTIVADPTTSTVFIIHDGSATSTIIKINASANTVIATYSPTLNTSERLKDAAWGNGKICVTTNGGGFERWLIIDPATGSTLASGNVTGTGTIAGQTPRVDYDTETQDFNIISTHSYTAAPLSRPTARFVNSNTYTTKVHNFSIGTLVQAGATVSVAFTNSTVGVPRWVTAASRYVLMHSYPTSITNGIGQFVFLSASTATTDHLTITGRQYMGTNPNTTDPGPGYAQRIIFAPSQSAIFYPNAGGQATGVTAGMRKIVLSNISSSYNTIGTTISFADHTATTVTPTSNLENNVLTNGVGTILPNSPGQGVIGFTDNNGVFFVQFSWWALFDEWLYRYGSTDTGSYGSLFRGSTFQTDTISGIQTNAVVGRTTNIAAGIDGGNTYIYYYRASSSPIEYAITGTKVGDIAKPYTIFPSSTNGGVSNYIGTSVSTAVFAIRPLINSSAYAIVSSTATAAPASYAVEPSTVLKVGITQSPLTSALAGSLTLKSWSVK